MYYYILHLIFFQVCSSPVKIHPLPGNHREVIIGESAKKIASLMN